MKKNEILNHSLIWTGAAISIAEILSGTLFADLGFQKGLIAIITGHLIGGALLFLAGIIGAKLNKSSMETTACSFGKYGSIFFALLNVAQLLGWTSIMIYQGAQAATGIFSLKMPVMCMIIGLLILLWIVIGINNIEKINLAAIISLFILTIVLCLKIFANKEEHSISNSCLSFGNAIELAIAMPLSWLPLISDYTKNAEHKTKTPLASAITYTLISCWMYIIGDRKSVV